MQVLILGLGQYPHGSGVEAAVYFAKRGDTVVVTDLKEKEALKKNVKRLSTYPNVRFVLGEHRLEDVRAADVVVPNPRVRPNSSFFQEAVRLGKTIESDVSLFLSACPAPVVGVTGTRGKSTTATLIAEMLKADGRHVWLGGNILVSPLTFLSKVKEMDWVVLELSSWQLELTGRKGISPRYAVWTNLMRDHLNTYANMAEYAEAKAQIFRHQDHEGLVLLSAERQFKIYADTAPGEVLRVGLPKSEACRIVETTKMKVRGVHNEQNAVSAVTMVRALGVDVATIKRVLREFPGLPNRQEEIAYIDGVRYINDTTSTTPDATIAALLCFAPHTIHLIFGGADKALDFKEVAKMIRRIRPHVYLLPGTAHEKICHAFTLAKIRWQDTSNLSEAMRGIFGLVKRGDVVLLSPGCASFGLFTNEFDRGEQFCKLVKKQAAKG